MVGRTPYGYWRMALPLTDAHTAGGVMVMGDRGGRDYW